MMDKLELLARQTELMKLQLHIVERLNEIEKELKQYEN